MSLNGLFVDSGSGTGSLFQIAGRSVTLAHILETS